MVGDGCQGGYRVGKKMQASEADRGTCFPLEMVEGASSILIRPAITAIQKACRDSLVETARLSCDLGRVVGLSALIVSV